MFFDLVYFLLLFFCFLRHSHTMITLAGQKLAMWSTNSNICRLCLPSARFKAMHHHTLLSVCLFLDFFETWSHTVAKARSQLTMQYSVILCLGLQSAEIIGVNRRTQLPFSLLLMLKLCIVLLK